ncbi:MAG: tRNA (N(6)-L-threonylcarbamoyladenosine(37)-C(2))-methylthiotransferase [Candidatus Altiarchaeales archaeon]|nr:tRNA (N(6)-L-threonylcarbamoyladenosine(37)-C(2))-methylthiotransferase [Candidatus Altiarchaeales archaeon]
MNVEIETYGCAMNQADSEIIAGLLEKHGHKIVKKEGEILVVNTCTVKTPTENKIRRRLKELDKQNRNVIAAGCLPAACRQIADEFPRFSFIGVNVQDVVEAVETVGRGSRFVLIASPGVKVCMPKNRLNPFVEIVPIAEGCLGNCSYCLTKAARGSLKSFAGEKIVSHVKSALAEGVREIWLTAQDTGAYGKDIKSSLPELLNEIVKIPGDFKVRVGMMNPNHVLDFTEELVEVLKNEKLYRFLHLPVQAGSDRILKEMGRRYCGKDFREIVREFREKLGTTSTFNKGASKEGHSAPLQPLKLATLACYTSTKGCQNEQEHATPSSTPQITLSTDIIVGYPTETEEDFKKTLNMIEDVKPDIINISRFWPRPGTKAAELKQHPGWLIKKRSGMVNDLFKKIGLNQNKKWVGWKGSALVSEKNKDGSYTARNLWYKPIIIKTRKDIFGEIVNVTVKKATYYDLLGEVD